MDIKKSGYISAILTTIIGIIVFLILEGVIKLDNTSSLINTEIITPVCNNPTGAS